MISRSKFLTVAAILQFLMGIFELISALPILAAGRAGMPPPPGTEQLGMGGPPFWAGVLFLILAVVSLFGAYGLWINQKWGKVVAVITRVLFGLFALGDVLNSVFAAYYGLALASVVYVLASILVIVLVLRRESRTVTA